MKGYWPGHWAPAKVPLGRIAYLTPEGNGHVFASSAKGDGVTDDTAAIQEAIDTAQETQP